MTFSTSFPEFKFLELSDKEFVEEYMKTYLPYSDFNFDSLWSYNTQNSVQISLLHGNLVVLFQDYITKEPFLSFIGTNAVRETIELLLQYSKDHHMAPKLTLIPEISLFKERKELHEAFHITEDHDNFDYIYLVEKLVKLEGDIYRGKRNFVNRFRKLYANHSYAILDLTDAQVQKQILDIFQIWEMNAAKDRAETENELEAIRRIMLLSNSQNLITIGVFVGTQMVAFSINEKTYHDFGVIQFEKADTDFEGSYQYLKQITALELHKQGCKYINYEQDLGLENLRKAKKSWHPIGYLKKYQISPRTFTTLVDQPYSQK